MCVRERNYVVNDSLSFFSYSVCAYERKNACVCEMHKQHVYVFDK